MNDAALAKLVHEYQTKPDYGRRLEAYLKYFKRLPLPEAIERAGFLKNGDVHDHQRLVGKWKLGQASQALIRSIDDLKVCRSFDELHAFVGKHTRRIERFGVLARYDISLRIGASLGLQPEIVHLHAGTRLGCKALGVLVKGKTVEMAALPKPVQVLEPLHAENFLCIFKDAFKGSPGRTPKSCVPKPNGC